MSSGKKLWRLDFNQIIPQEAARTFFRYNGKYKGMYQAFAVLLKDKATGRKRGKRYFGDIIALRVVDFENAMTAGVTKIPWKVLEKIQKRITGEIPSVVKVLFDITPKPPSTIEYI